MVELIISGVRCVVSEKVAEKYERELDEIKREQEEQAREDEDRAFVWNVARQYVKSGSEATYSFFSDVYKDFYGVRPRYSREELRLMILRRDNVKITKEHPWLT